jgi:Tfp pilus assembly protein PilV
VSIADPRATAGSALVEALVALVLMAVAGAVVTAASVAGLRATHRAATLTRTTALASRELATLATRATRAAVTAREDTVLTVPGFADPVECTTEVQRDGTVISLALHLSAGRPAEHVALATRVQVDE